MRTVDRLETWDRRTGYVLSIASGQLNDAVLGRPLVDGDAFTMAARAYVNDTSITPGVISGASSVNFAWQAGTARWVAELPYVSAFDTLTGVRVIATLTANSVTHDLMDATVAFTRADGR